MNAIREAVTREGSVRLFRNNVGALPDPKGRGYIRFGLAVGSADLIGVMRPNGRFVALEIKMPNGRVTPDQEAWLKTIRDFGGVAEVVRSVDEALLVVEKAKQQR